MQFCELGLQINEKKDFLESHNDVLCSLSATDFYGLIIIRVDEYNICKQRFHTFWCSGLQRSMCNLLIVLRSW